MHKVQTAVGNFVGYVVGVGFVLVTGTNGK